MIARTEANSILDLGVIQWRISAIGRIQFGKVLVGLLLYVTMQSLIDWLNEGSWHQLSTIAQPWTAPVSLLGHSWPTFSLFLPVQSSLFTLLSAELFISSSDQNSKEVSIISEWPSCTSFQRAEFGFFSSIHFEESVKMLLFASRISEQPNEYVPQCAEKWEKKIRDRNRKNR